MAKKSSISIKYQKFSQRTQLKLFCIDLVLILFSWGGFYRCMFGHSDALFDVINPEASKGSRIGCFRWAGYIVDMFAWKRLHFLASEHYKLSLFLMLLFMAVSLWIIQLMFLPLFRNKVQNSAGTIFYIASTALIFINVLNSELFYYTESFSIFKFSLLFCSLGCFLFTKKKYISAVICFVIMTCFYQVCCELAAILLAFWLFLKYDGKMCKSLFLQEATAISSPMLLGVINYLTGPTVIRLLHRFGMFYSPKKSIGNNNLFEVLVRWLHLLWEILQSNMNLTLKLYLPLILTVGTILLMALVFFSQHELDKFGTLLLVVSVSILVFSAIPIASGGNISPRTVFPFYAIESGLLLVTLYFIPLSETKHQITPFYVNLRSLICAGAGLFLLIQVFFIQNIISNRLLSNTLDLIYARNVLSMVAEYEAETGDKVKYICSAPDANSSQYYEDVYYKRDSVNERLYGISAYSLLEYISRPERHFEKKEMDPDIFKELFQENDWNSFDNEQVVIRDDTVYICIF